MLSSWKGQWCGEEAAASAWALPWVNRPPSAQTTTVWPLSAVGPANLGRQAAKDPGFPGTSCGGSHTSEGACEGTGQKVIQTRCEEGRRRWWETERESSWPFPGQSPEELREALAYPMGSFPDRAWPLGWSWLWFWLEKEHQALVISGTQFLPLEIKGLREDQWFSNLKRKKKWQWHSFFKWNLTWKPGWECSGSNKRGYAGHSSPGSPGPFWSRPGGNRRVPWLLGLQRGEVEGSEARGSTESPVIKQTRVQAPRCDLRRFTPPFWTLASPL